MQSGRLGRLGIALSNQTIRNCEKCAGLVPPFQQLSLYRFGQHDLLESAIAGCPLCNLILDELVANRVLSSVTQFGLSRNRQLMGIHLVSGGSTVYGKPNFSIKPLDELFGCVKGLPKRVENNTSSETCQKLVKEWMIKCIESHPRCAIQAPDSKWMPTRLLDGSQAFAAEGSVRLVNSSDLDVGSSYACLSHSWGGNQPIVLSADSQSQLLSGITISELPRTFSDAIKVVSWLKIRYLWIDSLCILQDSKEDWLNEASNMGQNYKNASITIAATDAIDCNAGLFRYRLPGIIIMPVVKAFQVRSLAEKEVQVAGVLNTKLWKDNVDNGSLNTRAWVLQERILSPRVLHFAKNQIFWECNSTKACETFIESIPPELDRETGTNLFMFADADCEERTALARYYSICEIYSKARLTYINDKLIAFSGIATEISRLTKWQYLAGLWRQNLAAQLLWTTRTPSDAGRPEAYRAPSWSWLSIDGEIKPPAYMKEPKPVLDIVNALTDLQKPDFPTGNIKGGYIEAKGFLRRFSFENRGRDEIQLLTGDGETFDGSTLTGITLSWDTESLRAVPDTSKQYYLLPVLFQGGGFGQPVVRGLIITPTEVDLTSHETWNSYTRLGVFEAHGPEMCRLIAHRECHGHGCSFEDLSRHNFNSHQHRMEDLRDQYDRLMAEAEPLQAKAKSIKTQQEDSAIASLAASAQTLRIV